MNVPVVLLDACTLYPAALRDLLMRIALYRLILVRWTDAIHDEWIGAVLRNRPELSRSHLERTRQLMDLYAEDSLVSGYEWRVEDLELPDPDDRHVLAAAMEAEAEILLTWNLRDFPKELLSPYGIEVLSPDALLSRLFKVRKRELISVLHEARTALNNPPLDSVRYLENLRNQGLVGFHSLLESHLGEI